MFLLLFYFKDFKNLIYKHSEKMFKIHKMAHCMLFFVFSALYITSVKSRPFMTLHSNREFLAMPEYNIICFQNCEVRKGRNSFNHARKGCQACDFVPHILKTKRKRNLFKSL